MLRQTPLFVLAAFALPTFAAFSCTVKSVDTTVPAETTSNVATVTGSGGSGAGGAGGAGGGSGGMGGSASTSSVGGGGGAPAATSSASGSGGGACAGAVGKGTPVNADCDKIPSAAAAHTCGATMTDAPPDPGVCHLGFTIYTQGSAEVLASCIGKIPLGSGNNCDDNADMGPIDMCVQTMYADACPNSQADDTCSTIQTACGADPFDVMTCKSDLQPFSAAGLQALVSNCINVAPHNSDKCQKSYDDCFAIVRTVQ